MKVHLDEVEFGRIEPIDSNQNRDSFQPPMEIPEETVERWRKAIADYDQAQREMEAFPNKVCRQCGYLDLVCECFLY